MCAHALSCNARLSAMVLQWPDAKLAVLLFTHLPHACKTQCVDYSINPHETRLQSCITFVNL